MQRMMRLLSLVLMLHLSAFSVLSGCSMSVPPESRAMTHETMSEHSGMAPHVAGSEWSDGATHCDTECQPAACAFSSHCTSVTELTVRAAAMAWLSVTAHSHLTVGSLVSVAGTPDPPPPRA